MVATDVPADTTMMRIVHDALRRDLARATKALADTELLTTKQRQSIGGHLGWLMRFLHAHHTSEDNGLYPAVRERASADDVVVLDRMHAAHDAIGVAMQRVERAATTLAADGSDEAVRAAHEALRGLSEPLLAHLRDEEDLAMPIVSRLLTHDEWLALEQRHNLDGKPASELGFEGHWLIDGATDADRRTVLGLVPPIPRVLLLIGYRRRYRRHTSACWRSSATPRRVQSENSVSVTVDAPIDEVWKLVADVTRVGEWSHECVGAEWLGTVRTAVPGARFRGRNRAGVFRWGRVCEVVAASPFELVWRTVPTTLFPDSSEWRIALDEVDGQTRITQSFRLLRVPKVLSVVYARMIPAHCDRTAALIADLERVGAIAKRTAGATERSRP